MFLGAVAATLMAAVAAFLRVSAEDGLSAIDVAMTVLLAFSLPWIVVGFWNALIGFVFLRRGQPLHRLVQLAGLDDDATPVTLRTALLMTLYNEDPTESFRRLRITLDSLEATGAARNFDVFVLSDSNQPDVIAAEERQFASFCDQDPRPERLHYRRRAQNTGFKAGNIEDFCDHFGARFDLMVVLDTDSLMSGPAILRLVRLMQANPRLGILQTLVVGLPASSAFPRIFQFGMRHGMRSYTVGSIWWQGTAGPYWGHNAVLRVQPFSAHCRLAPLPGRPPLGGCILSHDQVEAVLMRRAGYDVRVLPIEDGSYEDNPPTLPDFLKRDLRWCQGNLQYLRLLGRKGLPAMGRLQLLLAILMYSASPCWMAFIILGVTQAVAVSQGWMAPPAIAGGGSTPWIPALGWTLFVATIVMSLAPKLFGLLETLLDPRERQAFGGAPRVLAGAGIEFLLSTLLAPALALAQTRFIAGLCFGRAVIWKPQRRAGRRLPLLEAFRGLWLQTMTGVVIGAVFGAITPGLLPIAAPLILGLVLAAPIASLTADPAFGRWLYRRRLCAIPEDLKPPAEVRRACDFLALTEPAAQSLPARATPIAEAGDVR